MFQITAEDTYVMHSVRNFELAIRYLDIEHRKERAQPFHAPDCDLCDFILESITLANAI